MVRDASHGLTFSSRCGDGGGRSAGSPRRRMQQSVQALGLVGVMLGGEDLDQVVDGLMERVQRFESALDHGVGGLNEG